MRKLIIACLAALSAATAATSHEPGDRDHARDDWNDVGREVRERERDQETREQEARERETAELTDREREDAAADDERSMRPFGPPENYGAGDGPALPEKGDRPQS